MRYSHLSAALLIVTSATLAGQPVRTTHTKSKAPALRTSSAPSASPPTSIVYLKCVTTQHGQQLNWDLTLNEPAGTIDVYNDVFRNQQRKPAQFTADAVYFDGFTLSRVDLSLQRQLSPGDFERGTCQKNEPAARAF